MRLSIFLIGLFLSLIAIESFAQKGTLRYGYSSSAMGLGKGMPSFKKEVKSDAWTFFHYRQRIFELQVGWGDFTFLEPGDANYVSDDGIIFNAGFNIPLHKFTLKQRQNYLRGVHITPLMGIHYSTQSMGGISGKKLGQAGINLAPALAIQFPFGMIDLRVNNSFYFGGKSATEMANYRAKNYMFTPSITLQLDGLFELLGGEVTAAGDYSYNYTILAGEEVEYEEYSTFKTKTTRRKYETYNSSGISYVSTQRAFWYVSGKISKGLAVFNYGETATPLYSPGTGFGFGVGGRYKGFMGDVSFEKNNGFYAIRDPKLIDELEGFGGDYPLVEGRFNATEIRGKAGFDIFTLITGILMPKRRLALKNKSGNWVKFSRVHGGVSGGFGLPGKTTLYTPEGEAKLDAFFTSHPEIVRSKATDLTMAGGFTWNIGLFLNLEMGPISVEYDWHGNHNYGWRSSIGLTYLVPLQELLRGSKQVTQNW